VNVSFYATLRPIVGDRTVDVPAPPGASVRDLLRAATDLYPGLRPLLLDDSGVLLGNVHVIVNGRDVWYLSHGLETPLAETDKVLFFPAVGGGAST
jgi:sulfur-carrier protein